MAFLGKEPTPTEIARRWAAAYRDPARKAERFPCDPDAEFFPRDMDLVADALEKTQAELARLRADNDALRGLNEIGQSGIKMLETANARLRAALERISKCTFPVISSGGSHFGDTRDEMIREMKQVASVALGDEH